MKFFLLIIAFPSFCFGQLDSASNHRSTRFSSKTMVTDAFAIEVNPAGLCFIERFQFGLAAGNAFGIKDYSRVNIVLSKRLKNTGLGLGLSLEPNGALQDFQSKIGIGRKIDEHFFSGLTLTYRRINPKAQTSSKVNLISADLSSIYRLSDALAISFSFLNINRPKLSENPKESIGVSARLGMRYRANNKVYLYLDFINQSSKQLGFQTCIEYLNGTLFYRFSYDQSLKNLSLGLSRNSKLFSFDIRLSYHNRLGYSPSLQILYENN